MGRIGTSEADQHDGITDEAGQNDGSVRIAIADALPVRIAIAFDLLRICPSLGRYEQLLAAHLPLPSTRQQVQQVRFLMRAVVKQ